MRRRIFLPMTRVTALDAAPGHHHRRGQHAAVRAAADRDPRARRDPRPQGHASSTSGERSPSSTSAMEQDRTRDWVITEVFVAQGSGGGFRRRGETLIVDWDEVSGFGLRRGRTRAPPACSRRSRRCAPADLAGVLHELSPKRRAEVAAALDDEKLADVLEELPEDDQVEILGPARARARRRRPGGDGTRRRRRPARRAAARAGRAAARADGAGRGRRRAPAALLRRVHRRRHDDDRAGDPAAGRDRRRGAGPGAQRRAHPGAGRAGVRLPAAAGDPDRTVHRHRAHPAAAARAALRARVGRVRHRPRAARGRRRRCPR